MKQYVLHLNSQNNTKENNGISAKYKQKFSNYFAGQVKSFYLFSFTLSTSKVVSGREKRRKASKCENRPIFVGIFLEIQLDIFGEETCGQVVGFRLAYVSWKGFSVYTF